MMNYLWGIIILAGTVYAVFSGNISDVSLASINSSKEAVNVCIAMAGVMGLWMGMMEIAKKSGLITVITKYVRPLIHGLFPDIPKEHVVNEYIAANFIANFIGLSWAATPMGLRAMHELKKLNKNSNVASEDMCTFLIINVSSLQLIPINIIAYRSQYGSVSPERVILTTIIASFISTLSGVIFATIMRKKTDHHIK